MLLFEWLARGQADASPFQREKLETAEEENRKAAKTMQGKHICYLYSHFSVWFVKAAISFLLGLEQIVERSTKDYQTLKEENQSREKELRAQLTQVGVHMYKNTLIQEVQFDVTHFWFSLIFYFGFLFFLLYYIYSIPEFK